MSRKNRIEAALETAPVAENVSFPRWVLPLIVAFYCVLGLLLIKQVPLMAAPDEQAHFEYVEHMATLGTFPIFKPLGANTPGYEFHQPPLYYVVCAPLWRATGPGVQQYACRLVSLLFGAGTLIFLWGSTRALFPRSRELPILATGFAALLPLHIAVGASGGNDTAAGFFCAAMFWCVARGANDWTVRNSVLLGLFIGLGMLSKSTAFGVAIPMALGACVLAGQSATGDRVKSVFTTLVAVAGVAVIVCGWWLLRNTRLYGDPFAARIFDEAFRNSSPRPQMFFAQGISLVTYLRALLLEMFCTTWGFFGGPNSVLKALNPLGTGSLAPGAVPALLPMLVCAGVSVVGLLGLVRWSQTYRELPATTRTAVRVWGGGLVMVFLVWGRFNLIQFQGQARYVHPALLPIVLFMAIGWRQVVFNEEKSSMRGWIITSAFALLMVGLTLWNVFGWRTLV